MVYDLMMFTQQEPLISILTAILTMCTVVALWFLTDEIKRLNNEIKKIGK
jgi:hypothetical protein